MMTGVGTWLGMPQEQLSVRCAKSAALEENVQMSTTSVRTKFLFIASPYRPR
jgi:hypothetical protein